ncbi:zinc ABC transporter permease [Raineyella sp.]|uniref:zinc ABC transporter permease n=1 Tax=Raineyella sp. TaxID=1911550 RepID=UPI002B21CB7E|nr:zinc ABC transporter permease [Raineyella sp.]MEA5153967.1 zinc ABC transporter permease [Raineyella sp.]
MTAIVVDDRYRLPLVQRPTDSWRDLRFAELLVGLSIPFWRVGVPPGMPLDVGVFAAVVGACWIFVRPSVETPSLKWATLLYFAMLGHVVVVSVIVGQPWAQRSFRFVLLFLFAVMVAQGRLHWRSIVVGGLASLVLVNVPAFYAGLAPNDYPPYLTGWLGDKNVAGLYYAAFALLGLPLARKRWHQVVLVVVMFALVWATGSRTSIAALVCGLGWWLIRNRLPLPARLAAFGLGIWALTAVEETTSQIGPFADRTGTDLLRSEIHAAEQVKLAASPWYGDGLNTATVSVMHWESMWFHDSYAALRVEGGIPMFVAILVLFGGIGLGLLSVKRQVGSNLCAAEGAIIVLLVCAWQLGEVFFTSLAFLVLGIALYERLSTPLHEDAQP